MKQVFAVLAVLAVVAVGVSAAGCARITTQVVEKPRVDQQIEKGNRGYLQGKAPEVGTRKQTRQMFQADVEMATLEEMTPWKLRKGQKLTPAAAATAQPAVPKKAAGYWEQPQTRETPKSQPSHAQEESSSWQESSDEAAGAGKGSEGPSTTYTVKKGDTLEKISAAVYGDGSKWHRIFKANQDALKSPNRIYPGQKLRIPGIASEKKSEPSSQDPWK